MIMTMIAIILIVIIIMQTPRVSAVALALSSRTAQRLLNKCLHLSICACHPCAGAMLTFSVSFQVQRMIPEGNPIL